MADCIGVGCLRERTIAEFAAMRERIAALEAFKAYVHQRLDEAGVPYENPASPHTAAGCRMGGRLDLVLADAARFAWVLPIVSGDDDATADAHAMALALHLGRGLTGRTAIDAARLPANEGEQRNGG